jgi:hypothetical protein
MRTIADLTYSGDFNTFASGKHPARNELMQYHTETQDYLDNTLKPEVAKSLAGAGEMFKKATSGSFTLNPGEFKSVAITFPVAFPVGVIPLVVANCSETYFTCWPHNESNTGFTMDIRNLDLSVGHSCVFKYYAIG